MRYPATTSGFPGTDRELRFQQPEEPNSNDAHSPTLQESRSAVSRTGGYSTHLRLGGRRQNSAGRSGDLADRSYRTHHLGLSLHCQWLFEGRCDHPCTVSLSESRWQRGSMRCTRLPWRCSRQHASSGAGTSSARPRSVHGSSSGQAPAAAAALRRAGTALSPGDTVREPLRHGAVPNGRQQTRRRVLPRSHPGTGSPQTPEAVGGTRSVQKESLRLPREPRGRRHARLRGHLGLWVPGERKRELYPSRPIAPQRKARQTVNLYRLAR